MSVLILMYHRVARGPSQDRYTVSDANFRRQIAFLRDQNFRVVSLGEFVAALQLGQTFAKPSIAITFDDGFESTFEHAVPILQEYGIAATFFLVTSLVGKTNAWMNPAKSPVYPLMKWHQAEFLRGNGFELGSHTCSHPVLTQVTVELAQVEIENSKKEIEDRIGVAVHSFAYPHGAFNDQVRDLVRLAGYDCACSTLSGFNDGRADRFSLRRIDVFGDDSFSMFRRKLMFGANRVGAPEVLKYYLQRAQSKLIRA
jgi:peptidoglycan/xylan/chitin deacetylase (PgdA/CDA1 family)